MLKATAEARTQGEGMSVRHAHLQVCRPRGPHCCQGPHFLWDSLSTTGEAPGARVSKATAETLWSPQDLPGPSDLFASWAMMAATVY